MSSVLQTLKESYSDCIGTLSESSSRNDSEEDEMIHSDRQVFLFDKVVEKIYGANKPKSFDALFEEKKRLIAVEYKGGFRNKLNLPADKIDLCEYLDNRGEEYHCKDYLDVFKRCRKSEKKENTISVYAKALDGYLILSNELNYNRDDGIELWYIAVIDNNIIPDKMDVMADVLYQASGKHKGNVKDNELINLRKALHNLHSRGQKSGHPYLYDRVDVKTAQEFEKEYGN